MKIDFVNDRRNYLRPQPKGKAELLAKACGLNKGLSDVVDATAGLCRDAIFLVRLGARVRAVERNPQVFSALKEAHLRWMDHKSALASKLQIYAGDSAEYLKSLDSAQHPEVVYIDPMFTEVGKKSLPKKEMQQFRELTAHDPHNEVELLEVARKVARFRVVVKRSLKDPELSPGVAFSLKGKLIRFDIYVQKI